MNTKISIVVPVYNQAQYLRECLDSVLTQNFRDFEIICVDDGSTDGSTEILAEYATKDSRVKIVSQINCGTSVARKNGVIASSGDYIMFLGPDDAFPPNALANAYFAISHMNVDMLQFGTRIETSEDVPEERLASVKRFSTPFSGNFIGSDAILEAMFLCEEPAFFNLQSCIYRGEVCRKALVEMENARILIGEDGYAFLLIAFFSKSATSISDVCYLYRFGNGISGEDCSMKKLRRACEDLALISAALRRFAGKQSGEVFRLAVEAYENNLLKACWTHTVSLLCSGVERREAAELILRAVPPEAAIRAALEMKWVSMSFWVDLFRALPALEYQPRRIKTIGLIGKRLHNGGVERVISLLVPILQKMGLSVILFMNEVPTENDYPVSNDVKRVLLPTADLGERVSVLSRTIVESQIDLVWHHLYYDQTLIWDLLTVKALKIPFILTHHCIFSGLIAAGDINFLLLLKTVRLADVILTLSHTDAYFFHSCGVRSEYIPNPLTFAVEDAPPREIHEKQPPVILFPARVSPEKQPLEAIFILSEVVKTIPDAVLEIAGVGDNPELNEAIGETIRRFHLENHVRLLGYCRNMPEVFARADVMLMTSLFEGFPMTLLEAKAVGLPVVAYDLPYLEAMEPGTGVATVPQADRTGAAAEIIRLLTKPTLYSEFSAAGRGNARFFADYNLKQAYGELFHSFEQKTPAPSPDSVHSPERLMLETLLQSIRLMASKVYREGRTDRQKEITIGLTWRIGHLLTAFPLWLKKHFIGEK